VSSIEASPWADTVLDSITNITSLCARKDTLISRWNEEQTSSHLRREGNAGQALWAGPQPLIK